MLLGAQELHWDPVNPSKQYTDHYFCPQLRASHSHTPFPSWATPWEMSIMYSGRSELEEGELTSCREEDDEHPAEGKVGMHPWGFGGDIWLVPNPGPAIHNFPMPIKTGILGNQGFLASFLENTECERPSTWCPLRTIDYHGSDQGSGVIKIKGHMIRLLRKSREGP